MVLLLAQGLALWLFLHALLGSVGGDRSFSWDLMNHEHEQMHSLTVCDSLRISFSNDGKAGQAPYTLLVLEAGGILTATQIHEDGLWQVKHRDGSRLLLVLVDSLGNPSGILPTVFTVKSGSSNCLPPMPSVALIPTVIINVTHLESSNSLHLSISGGVPPHTIILASPGAPMLQHYTVPQGSSIFSLINNAIELRQSVIAAVCDSSGIFGQTTEFIEGSDSSGMSCKVESPQERTEKFDLAARSSGSVKISHRGTIIVAVCTSVGGTMILAALCFAVVMLRRRRRGLVAGQDARPRPFAVAIPAPTNTSPPRVNVSVPLSVIDISQRNNWIAPPTDASSIRSPVAPISPSHSHVRQPATPLQSSNTSLRFPEDPHSRPPHNPSSSSVQTPHAYSSSRPPRQQQSNSSMRSANQNFHPPNIPLTTQRSSPAQDGKLFKPQSRPEKHERILHPSRSTGDIHNNTAHPHWQHPTMPRSTSDGRDLNQLRHYYSTSNIRHGDRRTPEGVSIHQQRDGGDPPPPYHRLGLPGK